MGTHPPSVCVLYSAAPGKCRYLFHLYRGSAGLGLVLCVAQYGLYPAMFALVCAVLIIQAHLLYDAGSPPD